MRQKSFAYSLLMLLMLFSGTGAFAQKKEKKDSLVRLLGCNELRQMEVLGVSYRKACGNASFEHNSTKLLCDTALWNVNTNIIKAIGHVRIIQNRTVLTSDKLDYFIDDNLAQFRGSVVQLQDKDKNTLRTKDLDYNTKDSVAIFRNGGALRDKDGQIIESNFGSYDSKTATFSFIGNVNMYTDSVFVKTDNLEFNTQTNIAVFGSGTNAWRGSSMLSASAGWYNRSDEVFLFYRKVHVMTENQEAWSDSLKYYKVPNNVELFGHCELLDTTRHAAALAGYMYYNDSTSLIRMTRDPAIIMESKEGDKVDTVYVGADRLVYWTVPRCNVAESEIKDSEKRLEEIGGDPVTAYRQKAAEAARIAAEKARKQLEEEDPNAMGAMDRGSGAARRKAATQSGSVQAPPGTIQSPPAPSGTVQAPSGTIQSPPAPSGTVQAPPGTIQSPPAPSGTVQPAAYSRPVPSPILPAPDDGSWEPLLPGYSFAPQEPDSLKSSQEGPASMAASPDSLSAQPDSVAVADSTKIGFLQGIGNVKVFRKDMQVACDSLAYNDLDSLIRLYRNPVVWNETRRQYSADSIAVVVKDKAIEKASLMSNAFIIVQEDSLGRCFDQIKSAEMLAFFDSTGALRRFDAMGDASGIFYIEEQKALATVNKFESKMMTAILADGTIQDITYFDGIKSDAYPVVQMKPDEKVLKGFQWQPEKRPKGPQDITSLKPRKSERERYEAIPRAQFNQTDTYFPGHMKGVYKMLQQQDSLNRAKRAERRRLEELGRQQAAVADSLAGAVSSDSLSGPAGAPAGSVNIPGKDGAPSTLQAPDSSVTAAGGSLAASRDSLAAAGALVAAGDSLAAVGGAEVSGAGNLPTLDSSGVKVSATDTLSSPSAAAKENKPVAIDQEAVARARERVAREQARREAQAAKEARKAEKDAAAAAKAAAREAEWARRDSIDAVKAALKAEKKARKENARRMKQLEAARKRAAREQAIIEKYMAKYEKQKAKEEEKAARKAQKAALKEASEAEKAARKAASESEKAASKATPGAEKAARKAASEAEKVGD